MGKKGRKFIDKKTAVTFHLVHRSQRDPLTADDEAPQRVLKDVTLRSEDENKRKEEQRQYGIYYDDDYDYMQHLKDMKEFHSGLEPVAAPQLKLPAQAFESGLKEDVGLLNRAAPYSGPRLDWDPDIVAAMDEDFDYDDPENQLEDDFVAMANDEQFTDNLEVVEEEESDDEFGSNEEMRSFCEEETRSRYSHYSLTSSVLPRSEQLQLLDSRFDKLLDAYEDDHLGALEEEDVQGDVDPNSDRVIQMAEEFLKEKNQHLTIPVVEEMNGYNEEESSDEEYEVVKVPEKTIEYDCESILSTYSNLYNHPKVIPYEPIKVSHKTGLPVNIHKRGLTKKDLRLLDQQAEVEDDETASRISRRSILSELSIREKGETPEERRERKSALKEYRRDRRQEKKANTTAFKDERKRQQKQLMNTRHSLNVLKIL